MNRIFGKTVRLSVPVALPTLVTVAIALRTVAPTVLGVQPCVSVVVDPGPTNPDWVPIVTPLTTNETETEPPLTFVLRTEATRVVAEPTTGMPGDAASVVVRPVDPVPPLPPPRRTGRETEFGCFALSVALMKTKNVHEVFVTAGAMV